MASIVSSGIGSGLDIAGIVQQLVAAEGQPVESRIALQEARAQSKLSAFGSLKSALSDLRDKLDVMRSLDDFLARKASSSDENIFTATAGKTALPASYSLEVVQLAQAQRLTSGAFADSDAEVGTGTLTLAVGAATADIEITTENNTLAGIRDAINSASDNPGVSATIVNADSGSYLIVTSNKSGVANEITISQAGGDGGLAALEYDPAPGPPDAMTESVAAQDALIRIDGLDVMSDTNTFDGAVDGVSISVFAETAAATEVLSVDNDTDAVKTLVTDFVESYNALIDTFNAITDYDAENEIAAPLIGDSSVRSIRDQIRRELSEAVDVDATFSMLRDIGVEGQLDGKLKINDDELAPVLDADFVKFGQLFANPDGFAVRLHDLASGYLDSDGLIEDRTKGLTEQIDSYADDRESLNERLASFETRLLRQFNALDSLLAQLSSTSNFLTQQLDNLPGNSRPGSNNG